MSAPLPMPHANIVVTEFEGGESVLVDLDTKRYYQLNETATVIWQALADGRSKTDIVARLTSVYDTTEEDAEKNVDRILEQLKVQRLVVTA
ncbi:MAG: PqqD family protein [Thermoanaerobaculia bacterium]